MMLVSVTSVDNIMSVIYAAPRPYWVTDTITGLTCTTDFGNPSSKVIVTAGLGLVLWLGFIDKHETSRSLVAER